jgi:hypothetical protein
MTRVLSSACVVLLLLGLGGSAWAGKPPIAILGLEVYDNGSGVDPETTRAAKELTAALRDRAKAGTGPYTPVQGGEKELIDEKLLNNCDSEAAVCMAAIGTELGAEILIFGKIEKANQSGQAMYKVTLKLLQVSRKQISTTTENLPVDSASGVKASAAAKLWYAKLTGGNGGTLVVKAGNIDRGTVLIDGEDKGNLTSGTFTLQGLPEGRYTLAIEAKDYQRYETRITIRAGETTTQPVTMVEMSKKPPPPVVGERISTEGTVTAGTRSNPWKPVFYTSAGITLVGAGFTVVEILQANSNIDKIASTSKLVSMQGTGNPKHLESSQCGSSEVLNFTGTPSDMADVKAFKDACNNFKYQKIGWVVTGVAGAAAIGSFIMAYVRGSGSESETKTARGGRKHRELVVTPIVTPQGGGATLRFDW